MTIAKLFENGRSQAIRIPKEYRINESEVVINKIGDVITIIPKSKATEIFLSSIGNFSDDFFKDGRKQPKLQTRKGL